MSCAFCCSLKLVPVLYMGTCRKRLKQYDGPAAYTVNALACISLPSVNPNLFLKAAFTGSAAIVCIELGWQGNSLGLWT